MFCSIRKLDGVGLSWSNFFRLDSAIIQLALLNLFTRLRKQGWLTK